MSEPKLRCPKCGAHNAYGGDAESYPCSRCGFDGRGGIAVAACDHDRSFVRWSTREIICYWCGELLGRK